MRNIIRVQTHEIKLNGLWCFIWWKLYSLLHWYSNFPAYFDKELPCRSGFLLVQVYWLLCLRNSLLSGSQNFELMHGLPCKLIVVSTFSICPPFEEQDSGVSTFLNEPTLMFVDSILTWRLQIVLSSSLFSNYLQLDLLLLSLRFLRLDLQLWVGI